MCVTPPLVQGLVRPHVCVGGEGVSEVTYHTVGPWFRSDGSGAVVQERWPELPISDGKQAFYRGHLPPSPPAHDVIGGMDKRMRAQAELGV